MDCVKIGNLIYQLRREKGFTQKQIADALNITDKTISKWERGYGCPDVSLLRELSVILETDIEQILSGNLKPNHPDNGNMKKICFYVCPLCGNILTSTSKTSISCCGRKLTALIPQIQLEEHSISIEEMDADNYVSIDHPMTKEHYIPFIAYVGSDKILFNRLYPEQTCAIRVPSSFRGGILFAYCTEHGLFC